METACKSLSWHEGWHENWYFDSESMPEFWKQYSGYQRYHSCLRCWRCDSSMNKEGRIITPKMFYSGDKCRGKKTKEKVGTEIMKFQWYVSNYRISEISSRAQTHTHWNMGMLNWTHLSALSHLISHTTHIHTEDQTTQTLIPINSLLK